MQNDWSLSFAPAALYWLTGQNPYTTPLPFASPPWSLFVLSPLVWIPAEFAMLLPALALLYCAYRVRKPWLIPIVGLSFPFIAATAYANIDWMVMVGVVAGGRIGMILNTVKPQAGAFANVALLSQEPTWRGRFTLLMPLLILALVTIPLYGAWLGGMTTISTDTGTVRNFSLFPYSIPLGVIGLYLAWTRQSVLWGVIASLCLAPYFYIHSFMPLLFLIAHRDWRAGIAVNAAFWGILLLIVSGAVSISL
jgi:hypothetical protein